MKKNKIILIILAILVLVIIFLYLLFCTSVIEKHPSNASRDLFNYRLGDVVEFDSFNKNLGTKLVYKYYFRNTIASEYLDKIKHSDKSPDYKLLYNIMKEKAVNYETPPEDTLIIHLRVGDVIDWEYSDSIDDLLEGKKSFHYLRDYNHFDHILAKLKDQDIKKIIIVGGYHTEEDHSRSEEYIAKIKEYIEKQEFEVKTRINKGTADEDFCYMSSSRYFSKSGGRYSDLVRKMVEYNNGIILEK